MRCSYSKEQFLVTVCTVHICYPS